MVISHPRETPFDDTDLESIGERVKHMNIVAHAQGYFYHLKGLSLRVDVHTENLLISQRFLTLQDPLAAQKFYQIAIEKFEEALNTDPNNKEILLSMSLTHVLMIEGSFSSSFEHLFCLCLLRITDRQTCIPMYRMPGSIRRTYEFSGLRSTASVLLWRLQNTIGTSSAIGLGRWLTE